MDAKSGIKALAIGGKDASTTTHALLEGQDYSVISVESGAPKRGLYDLIVSYHDLQRVPYWDAVKEVKAYAHRLKPGGELLIFVPSLAWAAEQVLMAEPSPLIKYHLFGSKHRGRPNKNGFTMRELRDVCERAGIAVTHAAAGEYTVIYQNEAFQAEELLIRGVHRDNEIQE